ncbi:MAG: HPF/RaiA family ribosome-associated protein [Saprospiraceae bacterium]
MTIQLNTDKNLSIQGEYAEKLEAMLSAGLTRFTDHITRLEAHFSDENGAKGGVKDKRCLLEARIAGRQPVAVTEIADTYDLAVSGAIDKMKTVLTKSLETHK